MTDDDALYFGASLAILRHESRALVAKLPAHIRLRIPAVELASVSRSMHHEVLLRAATTGMMAIIMSGGPDDLIRSRS